MARPAGVRGKKMKGVCRGGGGVGMGGKEKGCWKGGGGWGVGRVTRRSRHSSCNWDGSEKRFSSFCTSSLPLTWVSLGLLLVTAGLRSLSP